MATVPRAAPGTPVTVMSGERIDVENGHAFESRLVDVADLGLARLRESDDEALASGVRRMLRLLTTPDFRFGSGEKNRLD